MQQFVTTRNGIKTIISIPWTVDQLQYGQNQREKVKDEQDAFSKVPLVFRAINLRCNTLTSVPYKLYDESDNEVEAYPYQETTPFDDLIWRTEAALLLKGASFSVRLADVDGVEIGLQWLNPFTMKVKRINTGDDASSEIGFQQYVNGKLFPQASPNYWTTKEMFYIRQFSASDDIGFGTAPASVALGSSRLQHYLTFFAAQFFEAGAMPVTTLSLPENTQPAERERIENFFKKMIQGIRNAFKVVAVSGAVKAQILTPSFKDLAIPNVKAHAIDDVAWAFDIPKTVLTSESANRATAEIEMQNYLKHTIIPRTKFFEHQFNTKLLNEYGLRLEFHPQEMSELQEDEMMRSQAFRAYTISGMWPQLAAAVLGIDIPKEYQDEWNKKSEPIDTSKQILQPDMGQPTQPDAPVEPVKIVQMRNDLARWQRKSLKRLESGKKAQVEFESDFIPTEIKAGVTMLLEKAENSEAVKMIFTETIQHFCALPSNGHVQAEAKTAQRSDNEVVRSIESLTLGIRELIEHVKPSITVEPPIVNVVAPAVNVMPQVDVSGIKGDIGEAVVGMRSAFEQAAKKSEAGLEDWRGELRILQDQYEAKVSEMTVEQKTAFEELFTKAVKDVRANADRVIASQETLSAKEKSDAIKAEQMSQDLFTQLSAKLEAIFEAVTSTKTITVERDKDGRIKKLKQ